MLLKLLWEKTQRHTQIIQAYTFHDMKHLFSYQYKMIGGILNINIQLVFLLTYLHSLQKQ